MINQIPEDENLWTAKCYDVYLAETSLLNGQEALQEINLQAFGQCSTYFIINKFKVWKVSLEK